MRKFLRRIRKAIVATIFGEAGILAAIGIDYDSPAWWLQVVIIPLVTGIVTYTIPNDDARQPRAVVDDGTVRR